MIKILNGMCIFDLSLFICRKTAEKKAGREYNVRNSLIRSEIQDIQERSQVFKLNENVNLEKEFSFENEIKFSSNNHNKVRALHRKLYVLSQREQTAKNKFENPSF